MIVCDLKDWAREQHAFHPVIRQAISWIEQTDFSQLPAGKNAILADDRMFCLLQSMETRPASEMRAESHFDYVDIQFLLEGEEAYGVARTHPDHVVVEDGRPTRDVVFYHQTQNESVVTLSAGMFIVLFPHDLHRPCCQVNGPDAIRKAVIKIHRELFSAGGAL